MVAKRATLHNMSTETIKRELSESPGTLAARPNIHNTTVTLENNDYIPTVTF